MGGSLNRRRSSSIAAHLQPIGGLIGDGWIAGKVLRHSRQRWARAKGRPMDLAVAALRLVRTERATDIGRSLLPLIFPLE